MNLYTVYDRLAEACGPPFSAPNHAVARRMYADLIKSSNVSHNEYKLIFMGSYDEKSCVLEPQGIPEDLYVDVRMPEPMEDQNG